MSTYILGRGDLDVQVVGIIDDCIFEIEFGKLQTREVILTNERKAHIKNYHPESYALFEKHKTSIFSSPDIILKDAKNPGTVFMIKNLPDTNLNAIVRLSLETDTPGFKNSVMTFYKIRDRNLRKLIAKNKVLYSRL